MAKVFHYIPQVSSKFICSKGGLHAQEALNIVCLDPRCRNDPLGCSICYVNTHKHHRVVSVDKFVDEYARNSKDVNQKVAMKKIERHHGEVKKLINILRNDVNKELDNFEESINEYADELRSKTYLRDCISQSLGIPLEPSKVKQSKNNEEFRDTLKFILNNSLFDSNNNMIRVADILKKNQERIFALLDKMVNMTEHCQEYIKDVMKTLRFSDDTIKNEKFIYKKQLAKMNIDRDQFDQKEFKAKETLNQTIAQTMELRKPFWRDTLVNLEQPQPDVPKDFKFTFSMKNKHQMIEVKDRFSVGISNITAIKPQYALLTPHLNALPTQAQQWTLRVNNCRNFASQNTMAVGLLTLNDISNSNFQGIYPKNASMLTSQGYVLENGTSRKTNMIFGTGDILYCRYDPYYKLFEISKENGRKLTLKVDRPEKEDLFIGVRLTYASDQVQIL